MLIDEVTITIKAGNGGDGIVAFRREKYVPKGGPWGGNGGNGGDVYIEARGDIGILRRYRNKRFWQAEDGKPGGRAKKKGKNGRDLILLVAIGTVVTDQREGKVYDFDSQGQRILIARGGLGGRGNWEFATSTQQTPRFAEKGEKVKEKKLTFELKLIADIGFIGFPNVGKTSMLNELTNASAKIGNYHFTTLEPNLGTLDGLILADIPGLIEGASRGKGLGCKFLKHITRTRVVAHCISSESKSIIKDYYVVRQEIEDYSKDLLQQKEIILLTKTDLIGRSSEKKMINQLKKINKNVLAVSIHDWDKIKTLREYLLSLKLV